MSRGVERSVGEARVRGAAMVAHMRGQEFGWVAVGPLVGGIRIGAVHLDRDCMYLSRESDARVFDLEDLADPLFQGLEMCRRCGGWR